MQRCAIYARRERLLKAEQTTIRVLIQTGVVVVGAGLFAAVLQVPQAGVIPGIAVVLAIPGAIVSFLVFAPIEAAGVKLGAPRISMVLIPVVGAAVPWLLLPLAANKNEFLNGAGNLSWMGFAWGVLWVITALFKKAI
jgi:hypothetical protein